MFWQQHLTDTAAPIVTGHPLLACQNASWYGHVVAGVPKALFGFDAAQLVGQTLSSVIDVFSEWKVGCGEEMSLLQMLASQMMAAVEPDGAATISGSGGCASWRAGVHRPTLGGSADDKVQCIAANTAIVNY